MFLLDRQNIIQQIRNTHTHRLWLTYNNKACKQNNRNIIFESVREKYYLTSVLSTHHISLLLPCLALRFYLQTDSVSNLPIIRSVIYLCDIIMYNLDWLLVY